MKENIQNLDHGDAYNGWLMSVESRGFESQNNSFIEHRNHLFQGNMDDEPVVAFKYFLNFHPDLWGETIRFEHIFQWGWLNHLLMMTFQGLS